MPFFAADTAPTSISALMAANAGQSNVGVLLQSYCNAVSEQDTVDFKGFATLAAFETEVNQGILVAKGHADTYLNTIQPAIITNIADIQNYFSLHGAILATCPPGSTKQQWLNSLAAMKDGVDESGERAAGVVTLLTGLHGGLTTDVAAFSRTVTRLNAAVSGDNGVLASLATQLNDLEGKIAGAITGIVLSGLAVVGGSIMILVGALAEAVTGGAATALVIGGAAVLVAGVGGAIGSGVALGGLISAKSDLIMKRTNLQAEVALAVGMQSGFADLRDQARSAVDAATAMQNAWNFLGSDLGQLSADLTKGIVGTDDLRQLWLTAANTEIKAVSTDIDIIKRQMTGVQNLKAPAGMHIGDFVTQKAQELAA